MSDIIQAREKTHGPWQATARISQDLKQALSRRPSYEIADPCQREAVEMILTKIARIASGNANHPDHWNDIIGYAMLGRDGGVKP